MLYDCDDSAYTGDLDVMAALRRRARCLCLLLTSLMLGGCLHLQLGGAVTASQVTVTPLRDPSTIVEQLMTPTLAEVIESSGAERWDSRSEGGRFTFLGNVTLDETLYDADTLYLVTASGGMDQDADADNFIDSASTPVAGQWHAILTGDQLTRGKVSPLTEAAYRYLEVNLDSLSDADVLAELDTLAQGMLGDTDRSGTVDYEDVLAWHRHFNADTYLHDIDRVNELSEALRNSASTSTLRTLSLAVIGESVDAAGPYTISGSVAVSATTRVDSDVNNPDAGFSSNDSLAQAQQIINPVFLGGYANRPNEGADGASTTFGDNDDYYRVDLLEGQVITLVMAENPSRNDLDLYLLDEFGATVDASLDVLEIEQLTVPASGVYYVVVRPFSGASNYQLTLGIGSLQAGGSSSLPSTLQRQPRKLSDDFVPGEIIARFRNQQRFDTLRKAGRMAAMRERGGGPGRSYLLEIDSTATAGADERRQDRKLRTLLALKELLRDDEVELASLNYIVKPFAEPNDVYYEQQRWHYEQINLPAAWERSLGDDVIVAVVDTGIRQGHPDLQGQLVPGYDFISNRSTAADGNGIDPDPEDPGDSGGGAPSSFHGTHVAGTIAAATNNNCGVTCQGVAGIAWNAKIMPLRALGVGGGTTYDVLQAVRFAARLSNDSGTLPTRAADIINLSLGGGGYSPADQAVYDDVIAKGILVVAAAGNESTSQFAYPASYSGVVSVSAVDINGDRAYYSNFGSAVDVAAPGGDSTTGDVNGDGVSDLVLSTGADDSGAGIVDTYTLLQGTSMATPHVAGVMALMKSVYPELTAEIFQDVLEQGAITDDLGSAGRDNTFGWGLINANKAVLVAESLASGDDLLVQPRVSTSATSLNFGNFADVLPLTISNGGTGTLVVDRILSGDNWLSVTPQDVDANGVGTYNVAVDRSQLVVGTYNSSIDVFTTNGGDTSVSIILQQPDPDTLTEGDAGLHYILLLNAETGRTFQQVSTNVVNGEYLFEFTNVPAGRYQIYAGSDADNDLLICDPGEACGAWPVLDPQPAVIELIQDLSGLRFSTTFSTSIVSESSADDTTSPRVLRRSSYRGEIEGNSPRP